MNNKFIEIIQLESTTLSEMLDNCNKYDESKIAYCYAELIKRGIEVNQVLIKKLNIYSNSKGYENIDSIVSYLISLNGNKNYNEFYRSNLDEILRRGNQNIIDNINAVNTCEDSKSEVKYQIGDLVININTGTQMIIKRINNMGIYSCYTNNGVTFEGDFDESEIEIFTGKNIITQQNNSNYDDKKSISYNKKNKYPALYTISIVLEIFAYLILITFLIVMFLISNIFAKTDMTIIFTIISLIGGIILFIVFLSYSEIIKLFIDIEKNTRKDL